jgi:hypothetical protein
MRVHVVSDVHARADALTKAGDGADALICLGDLVLFHAYDDPSGGIFADMFGEDAAVRLIQLRTERRHLRRPVRHRCRAPADQPADGAPVRPGARVLRPALELDRPGPR